MLKTFNILHQCKILPDLVALALRLISTVWAQVEVKCCCDLNNIVKYTEYDDYDTQKILLLLCI